MDFYARYESLQGHVPCSTDTAETQCLSPRANLSCARKLVNAPDFISFDKFVTYLQHIDVNLDHFEYKKKFDEGRDQQSSHASSSSKRRAGDSDTTYGNSVTSSITTSTRTAIATSRKTPNKYLSLPELFDEYRARLRRKKRMLPLP